jgi:uncharacterized protein with FMN-binding domain
MMKIIKYIVITLVIFILIGVAGVLYLRRDLEEVGEITINPVDVSLLNDGIYVGSFVSGRWTNEVAVTIKENQINKIKIIRDVSFPIERVKEELFNRVLQEQKVDIDVIAGATVTCKAYLKAIENALKGEIR